MAAGGVMPVQTVVLLHASTPCVVFGSRFLGIGREGAGYSHMQMIGASIIAIAMVVSISRAIGDITESHRISKAICALVFFVASALQGLVMLYKEQSVAAFGRRIDVFFLSSWLFHYQFMVALLLSPFLYVLQGICAGDFRAFPLSSMTQNLKDGWECLLGNHPSDSAPYSTEWGNECSLCLLLVLCYVVSNVLTLVCIDSVLRTSNQILGRVLAAAVAVSFISLAIYDKSNSLLVAPGLWGTTMVWRDVLSLTLLLVGMELYARDSEPNIEIITNFPSNTPSNSGGSPSAEVPLVESGNEDTPQI